jgi:polyisoprenoid-binding protein YceI
MKSLFLKIILIVSLSIGLKAEELLIDESHSHIGFSIKHMMISNVKGDFKKYNGDIDFDMKSKTFKVFDTTVDASSIDTGIKKRDDHLRSADFFDVEKYKDITFKMSSHTGDIMKGILTIHGVSKEINLKVEYNGTIKDFRGNTKLGFSISGKINRKDFGLTWNKLLEAGGLAVGDKVKISIELQTIVL